MVDGKTAIAHQVTMVEVPVGKRFSGETIFEKQPHSVEAHFVDDLGNTYLQMKVPYHECRQALLKEIPERRRPARHPGVEKLGYK